ncbi:MAG: plastocyanin/azurin family copper-binding protein [Dehalococcoidia bacterium]
MDSQLPFRRVAITLATIALVASACGGAAATPVETIAPIATPPPTAAADVNIDLAEWKVTAPSTLTAGQVNLVMKNSGTGEHELLVFKSDLALSAYPKDASGDIVEDGPGVDLVSDGENIAPGGTQTRALDLSQPGTYLFVCNIPGHFKSGMYQVVTVTAP